MPDVTHMAAIALVALLVDVFLAPMFKGDARVIPQAEAAREGPPDDGPIILAGEGW